MTVKKVLIFCASALLLTILLEIIFVKHKTYYWWHEFIGFDIAFGFLGCIVIIKVSKFLGKAFIQRKENYYDGGGDNDDDD